MKIIFSPKALDDFEYWRKRGDAVLLKRIEILLVSIQQDPFKGIGKPEPLKYGLSGAWSRRINQEHRIVYRVTDDAIEVIQLRHHY
jgi:toxin YoeB